MIFYLFKIKTQKCFYSDLFYRFCIKNKSLEGNVRSQIFKNLFSKNK